MTGRAARLLRLGGLLVAGALLFVAGLFLTRSLLQPKEEAPASRPASSEEGDPHAHPSHDPSGQPSGTTRDAQEEGEVAYYTCPMHPSVQQHGPGQCPICGMDLVPVSQEALKSGVVIIDNFRRQRIGVRTGRVVEAPMTRTVRAVGILEYDERRLAVATAKVRGWVRELEVDAVGDRVKKGQVLLTLYSPELWSAQVELLTAAGQNGRGSRLSSTARQRLRLFGIADRDIDALLRRGRPSEALPIRAETSGVVIEKSVVEGSPVDPMQPLLRIANLEQVWVKAQIFEDALALVEAGQEASVTLTYDPGRTYSARVDEVYPWVQESSRTGEARLVLDNASGELRPGMYATVHLKARLGRRLQVPEEAVLFVGPERLVFVDIGDDRLKPVKVEVGHRAGGYYEVLSGLEEGDRVVTSGGFLVASESRLSSPSGTLGGGDHGAR